jgi:hypothetical protein
MKENIEIFNNKYDNIFKKFENIKNIKQNFNNNENKFLYIFDIDCYYNPNEIKLPENTCKLGMTIQHIYSRLNSYPNPSSIKNIECIQCENPDKRERLVKGFLKHKTEFKPIAGKEYFKDCKHIIKLIYIVLYQIDEEDIIISYNYYNTKDEKYNIIFDYIYSVYNNVLKDINFTLTNKQKLYSENEPYLNLNNNIIINEIKVENDVQIYNQNNNQEYICEFCNTKFCSKQSLNLHKRIAKFCLTIQKQKNTVTISETQEFKCEFCYKDFGNTRYLNQHITICKQKKEQINNDIKKELEITKKELEESNKKVKELINENIELKAYLKAYLKMYTK